MSEFFGIFRPDGGKIDMDQFDRMKSAMHRDGYDGMETYVDGNIAVGHLMLRVGNASEFDKQPLKSDCGNYLLVGHFRLDYRDELGDKLGLTQMELEVTPDSKLVLMAYLKWKDKCVHHLEGDWIFVVFNKKNIEIQLYKSWIGNSNLYYIFEDGVLIFCSCIQDIIKALKGKLKFDEERVVDLLLSTVNLVDGKTIFLGLCYLKNGSTLFFSEKYQLNSIYPINKSRSIYYKFDYDYKLDYLSLLSYAVKTRITRFNKIGIFLSGGLDSSAVGFFLAKELLYLKRDLFSFTSIPYFEKELSENSGKNIIYNESKFVNEYCNQHPNLKAEFLEFREENPLEILFKLSKENAYSPSVNKNVFWILGILKKAKEKGIGLIFTAQAGNYTISQSGSNFYVGLLLNLKIKKLLKLFLKQSVGFGFFKVLKIQLLIPFVIYFRSHLIWNKISGSSFRRFIKSINIESQDNLPRKVLRFRDQLRNFIPKMKKGLDYEINFFEFVGNMWSFFKDYFQICVSDPTTDLRVVIFLNSIPGELFFKDLRRKYLFKYSFDGLLPEKALKNNKRMLQSYDFPFRMSKMSVEEFSLSLKKQKNTTFSFNDFEIINTYQRIKLNPEKYVENYELIEFLKVLSYRNVCNSD